VTEAAAAMKHDAPRILVAHTVAQVHGSLVFEDLPGRGESSQERPSPPTESEPQD
jgi:hypothetical protein